MLTCWYLVGAYVLWVAVSVWALAAGDHDEWRQG